MSPQKSTAGPEPRASVGGGGLPTLAGQLGDVGHQESMGEGQVVAMAAVAWAGALLSTVVAPPILGSLAVIGLAFAVRRPIVLVIGVGLLAASLGHRADEAYRPVAPTELRDEEVMVLDDPRPLAGGWVATVRLTDRSRVQARGWGRAGFGLGTAGAGDRLLVTGRLVPVDDSPWARSRHLVGRLQLDGVERLGGPSGPRALVEAIRSRIVAGADQTPASMRPLYLGLVVGEDRFQPSDQRARFAAAGLSHLLAVSGQNVAFVLAVLRPVSSRLGGRARPVLILAVLAAFAVATRLEPSVLRASAVAALATIAALGGHRQSGTRLLALAVTALVLIDPFLVHAIGFQLSVAASAGILILGPVIHQRVPLPEPAAGAVSVTVSAQITVVPILGSVFGPVSAVSVPANLLGGWAAGLVMMWGLTVGVVAGSAGGWLGSALQAPPTVAMWWLDRVAAVAARLPMPAFTGSSLLAIVAVLAGVRLLGGRGAARRHATLHAFRLSMRIVLVGALLAAAVAAVPDRPATTAALPGGGWYVPSSNGAPSVLVIRADAHDGLLDAIVGARITAVDVVVVESGTGSAAAIARATARLVPTGVVLAPPLHRVVGGRRVTADLTIPTGYTTLTIEPDGTRLTVRGEPIGPP